MCVLLYLLMNSISDYSCLPLRPDQLPTCFVSGALFVIHLVLFVCHSPVILIFWMALVFILSCLASTFLGKLWFALALV